CAEQAIGEGNRIPHPTLVRPGALSTDKSDETASGAASRAEHSPIAVLTGRGTFPGARGRRWRGDTSVPTPRGHGDDGWQGTRWHASQCAAPGHRRPGSLGAGLEDARAAHADARPAAAGGPDLRAVLLCVPGLLAGPREP